VPVKHVPDHASLTDSIIYRLAYHTQVLSNFSTTAVTILQLVSRTMAVSVYILWNADYWKAVCILWNANYAWTLPYLPVVRE